MIERKTLRDAQLLDIFGQPRDLILPKGFLVRLEPDMELLMQCIRARPGYTLCHVYVEQEWLWVPDDAIGIGAVVGSGANAEPAKLAH